MCGQHEVRHKNVIAVGKKLVYPIPHCHTITFFSQQKYQTYCFVREKNGLTMRNRVKYFVSNGNNI